MNCDDHIAFIKAVWMSGWRRGYDDGAQYESEYLHGLRTKNHTANDAWNDEIQWRLDTESVNFRMNISDKSDWESIP